MSAPAPRPARRVAHAAGSSAAVAAFGIWSLIKVAFAIFGLLVIGFGIWGYQHAHTSEFKMECAAYQAHVISMGFPDNALCLMFWQLS